MSAEIILSARNLSYIALAARGTGATVEAVLLLMVPGSILVVLGAGLGVLVSSLAPTNLVSFVLSAGVVLFLAAPSLLPGSVRDLALVKWLVTSDPMTAVACYQSALVVDGRPWTGSLGLLVAPLVLLLLLAILGPRLLDRFLSLH